MESANKIPPALSLTVAGTAITIASIWYGQHHGWMPVAASENAPLVDGLFDLMMGISTWLFLSIQGAIVLAIIKFRKKPGDETDGPPVEGNILLELIWTAIPVVIVMILAVYSFDVYQQMGGLDPMASHDHSTMASKSGAAIAGPLDETATADDEQQIALGIGASPDAEGNAADLTVEVMGLQYAWLYTYPGGVGTGELHVPVGQDIQLNIQAMDVLHAFWVPQFRLKQDAIPGRTTQLRFRPEELGTYPVVCAELCGPYHGVMRSQIIVDTQEDYDAWLETQLANAPDDSRIAIADLSDADRLALHPKAPAIDADAIAQLARTSSADLAAQPHAHHHTVQ